MTTTNLVWPKTQTFIPSQFWRPKSKIKVPARLVPPGDPEAESGLCFSLPSGGSQPSLRSVACTPAAVLQSLPLSSRCLLLSVYGTSFPPLFFYKETVTGFKMWPKFTMNSLEILNYICTIQPTTLGRGISTCNDKDAEKPGMFKERSFGVRGRTGHYSVDVLGVLSLTSMRRTRE